MMSRNTVFHTGVQIVSHYQLKSLGYIPVPADQKTSLLWLWFDQRELDRELVTFHGQPTPSHVSEFEHQISHCCKPADEATDQQTCINTTH